MVKSKRSKLVKSSNCSSSSNAIDRISGLPDHLISHILSLIPTKEAVATSVLSTRWKFLWTSITNLDFEFNCCWDGDFISKKKRAKIMQRKFTLFVKRVLFNLKSPSIHKFSLTLCTPDCFNLKYLQSWISAGFGRMIGEFSLDLENDVTNIQLTISQICFNFTVLKLSGGISLDITAAASLCCMSLKVLDLCQVTCEIGSNSSIIFPNLKIMHLDCVKFKNDNSSIIFPNLKIMHLSCVKFENDSSVYNLFSSSPVLDDLSILESTFVRNNMQRIIIHIPSLTRLSIRFYSYECNRMCRLKINAPALQYLKLECMLTHECLVVQNLPSLREADLRMFFFDFEKDDVNVESCIAMIRCLGRLSKVNFLYLSCDKFKDFRIVSTNIVSDSHNLTRLEMKMPKILDLSMMISSFLESMDNLEHLVMQPFDVGSGQLWWVEPLTVPKCLLSRLTTVSFTGIHTDCCDLLELLRYFLKNAKVLQMLMISTDRLSEKQQLVLLKKISLMPRASHTCQVAFT